MGNVISKMKTNIELHHNESVHETNQSKIKDNCNSKNPSE